MGKVGVQWSSGLIYKIIFRTWMHYLMMNKVLLFTVISTKQF